MKRLTITISAIIWVFASNLLGGEIPESVGIRNLSLGGSALALVENIDSVYWNPAGVIGLGQSYLNQTVNLNDTTNNFFSQTLILSLKSLPVFGSTVNMLKNDRVHTQNLSYQFFTAFPVLKIFSIGINMNRYLSLKEYNVGAIMSIPAGGFINRIGLGLLGKDFDSESLFFEGFTHRVAKNIYFGTHLRLKFAKSLVYNFTFDYDTVQDYQRIRFKDSRRYLGIEQILKSGKIELSLRAGVEFLRDKQESLSGGAGIKLDFISINAGVTGSKNALTYYFSTSYRLGGRILPEIQKEKVSEDESREITEEKTSEDKIHLSFLEHKEIKFTFSGVKDETTEKMVFLIDVPQTEDIEYWHLTIIDLNKSEVIKSYDNLGMPPEGIVLNYKMLPDGKYRADLTLMGKDGKNFGFGEVYFTKGTESGIRINAKNQQLIKGEKNEEEEFIKERYGDLNNPDQDIKFKAALRLAQSGNRRAIPVLKEVLKMDDAEMRCVAVLTLGKFKDDTVVSALREALRDKDEDVRLLAALILRRLRDKEEEASAAEDEYISGYTTESIRMINGGR